MKKVLYIVWFCISIASFFTSLSHANKKNSAYESRVPISSFTLRIQLSPAMCYLQAQRSKLKQCKDGYSMTVIGLRPHFVETEKNAKHDVVLESGSYVLRKRLLKRLGKQDCTSGSFHLPPLQEKLISRIMPDMVVQQLAWRRYGACTNMSAQTYFRMIANFAGKLNLPSELSSGNTYNVEKAPFKQALLQKNQQLQKSHVQLSCRKVEKSKTFLLTELQVCYDSDGKYNNCQFKNTKVCPDQFKIMGLP